MLYETLPTNSVLKMDQAISGSMCVKVEDQLKKLDENCFMGLGNKTTFSTWPCKLHTRKAAKQVCRWVAPSRRRFKLNVNVDGATFTELGMVGLGAISTDELVHVVVTTLDYVGRNFDAKNVESMAKLHALKVKVRLGYTEMMVEGDSLTMIEDIHFGGYESAAFCHLIQEDIKYHADLLDVSGFSHTFREGKLVAHSPAKLPRDYKTCKIRGGSST